MQKRAYLIFSFLFLLTVNSALAQAAQTAKEPPKEKTQKAEKSQGQHSMVEPPELAPLRFSFASDAYLGVYLEEVSAERMKDLKLKEERGAVVMKVAEGSPAEKAGLKENDVIVSFNGRRVDTVRELQRLLGETPAGRTVTFEVMRGGALQTLTATVTKRAANAGLLQGNLEPFKLREKELQKMEEQLKRSEVSRERAEEMRQRRWELQEKFQSAKPKDFGNFNFNYRGMNFWSGTRLGLAVESLNEQLGNYFGVKDGKGVLVTEVQKDSAAEKAGLQAGDVILEVDNQKIVSTHNLLAVLAKKPAGQLTLKILRNKDEKTVTVRLEKREALPAKKHRAMFFSPTVNVIYSEFHWPTTMTPG
ncbi:MAG: PDZ domain-containing protein [Acidobacteria bacterium]|nr:PDZ domain-containing protein [Acidobacteriota bacterium]